MRQRVQRRNVRVGWRNAARGATVLLSVGIAQLRAQQPGAPDWRAVDAAMGRAGAMQPGGVYKYSLPRSDLHVTVDGIPVKPALALGSWVAFLPMHGRVGTMVMGDLVLTEDEVSPVMVALQTGGIDQTAVHHHVLHETPRVFYMHIGATGDPVALARAIHAALSKSRTPLGAPAPAPAGGTFRLDTVAIRTALGHGGKVNGGVYQVSIPRAHQVREAGMEIPPAMGVATALNFQPTGGGTAAVTGDFVLTAAEVNPVIRALQGHGITVTALHNHMLTEEPRLFFMHFWGHADAVALARGLRAAVDRTASQR